MENKIIKALLVGIIGLALLEGCGGKGTENSISNADAADGKKYSETVRTV
jgi:hypothetical protein